MMPNDGDAAGSRVMPDDVVPGLAEALGAIDGFDDSLRNGLARVGAEQAAALSTMAGAMAATPLGPALAEAAAKVTAGSVSDDYLMTLAGARVAMLGAVHDALLEQLDSTLGRSRAGWEGGQAGKGETLPGCVSWLRELAITGWRGVDHDLVAVAGQLIPALLANPAHRRLAVLLDGFAAELRASCPVATMEQIPVRRWADLWSRALLLTQAASTSDGAEVSGRLLILGVDVHEHETAFQAQVHGILEATGAPARLVRTSVAAAKVDMITGPALWKLLPDYPVLLTALAEQRSVELSGMTLLASGDLIWDESKVKAGASADPFTTARVQLAKAVAAATPPLDRHPVRIAEPVFLEGSHDLDVQRLPSCGPLTPELVGAATACIGLMRWESGRWLVQPLAVQTSVKRKPVAVHNGDWAMGPADPKAAKAIGDTVAVLRERAGRLLRK